jgi:16S rRNA (cytosine1402-N4)-methyltransferase
MAACHMNEAFNKHIPVLLNEAISHLVTKAEGTYIDATFGRGNHSLAILNKLNEKGRLIALDRDPEAVQYAEHFIKDDRFSIFHSSFSTLATITNEQGLLGNIQGVLFDLGVSSPQIDNPNRGFSFTKAGPLDMRMDTTKGIPVSEWLAKIDETNLANILWTYGEERFARRIAKAIIETREVMPLERTDQLAQIIKSAIPKRAYSLADKHPATRSFQAIRIAINQEINELALGLEAAFNVLKKHGRLAVISFHSLEDRAVKQFIKQHEKKEASLQRRLPIQINEPQGLKTIAKIKPGAAEITHNPRARSAILRIAEKLL